jgi:hypothetical protein
MNANGSDRRAFVWTPQFGAFDLGDALGATLAAEGWDYFESANAVNEEGIIIGYGRRAGSGERGVFMVQLVADAP